MNEYMPKDFQYIMTEECKAVLEPLLIDGAYILSRNTRVLKNNGLKSIQPFYTESEVYRMLNKTGAYNKNEIHKLNDYVSFKFLPNGHIVGASSIVLYIKTPSGAIKKLYYSGDISSPNNKQPFTDDTEIEYKSTAVISEATYSDLSRGFKKDDIKKERTKMKKDILDCIKKGNSILIPAFAMSRTQNILEFLYSTFKDDTNFKTPIYLDGKLSLEINEVYREILNHEDKLYFNEILNWQNLHFVKSYEDSLNLALRRDEVKIVISSAGMCTVGRVLNHIKANVEYSNYTIMIIGYCAPNTVGGNLLDPRLKTIKIEGMEYQKNCQVIKYSTWSSHAQGQELINYFKQYHTDMIILHHSDDSKYSFRDEAERQLRESNKSTKIVCADSSNNIFFI